MHSSQITIIIVTWNSLKYLPHCLKSIFDQTFKNFSVIVIDNGSIDGTIDFVKKNYVQIAIQENSQNLGFAKANNQGIKISNSKYVLLCNHDIILEKDFIEEVLKTIECNPSAHSRNSGQASSGQVKIASVGGKLLKIKDLQNPRRTDIIDSCGIQAQKSHYFKEKGVAEKKNSHQDKIQEVFGISGALVLFKKSALEEIKLKNEYLDEDFFSYKEDVDIAWRLRLAGYKAIYNPNAIAYHFRGISKSDKRQTRSKIINQLSYKNHLLAIVKNQTPINLILFSPFILFYEFKKLVYLILFEQSTLLGLIQFIKQLPNALRKRKYIMSKRKINSKKIRRWFK